MAQGGNGVEVGGRIARTPLHHAVVDRIREYVESHEIRVGQKLPAERVLAEDFGVSRTSVRQAIAMLRDLGLIEVRHGDGTYLRRKLFRVRPEVVREVYGTGRELPLINEAREALGVAIAGLAARRRMPQHIDELKRLTAALSKDLGPESEEPLWRVLVDAGDNPLLRQFWEELVAASGSPPFAADGALGRVPQSAGWSALLRALDLQDERAATAAALVLISSPQTAKREPADA